MKQQQLEEIRNYKGTYPKQLWYLSLVEMWERFCFYGMRGILTIFMVDQFLLSDKVANLKYGAIQAFVYAFTFIGGVFADKILGFRKSLFFGGIVMATGNLLIAINPHDFFFWGITLSIVGTGFFKPNISTMVGELYKEGDKNRDAGFSLFYSGINLGSFLGGILCVYLGKYVSWNMAFLAASIVMVIGIIIFALTKKSLGPIGDSPLLALPKAKRTTREVMVYLGVLLCLPLIHIMIDNTDYTDIFMMIIGPAALVYFFYELSRTESAAAKKKMVAALLFIIFSIIFFGIFEQSGGSLALFAKYNLNNTFLGLPLDANIVNNSANALFVIIFSPLLGIIWLRLARKKLEPNTVVKFGLGFVLLGIAFYMFYYTRFFADWNTGKTNLELFTFGYLVVTFAELCLSPIGLSIVTKLSPQRLGGMMMGLWFLASAYGQYVAGLLGSHMSSPDEKAPAAVKLELFTEGYKQLGIYALIAGVLLIVIAPLVRKLMGDVK
ncbi:MAG TPA: peptide MFS transporter [Edaphocola sp.]|nr:peptide MFS transporter [Edaphocola sp.]